MNRINYPSLDFGITNLCNFNCDGCNRFNNFQFSGKMAWRDYADIYKQWAERINITHEIAVMGGEPTICPDFREWLWGVHQLWPDTTVKLRTNGSLLKPDDTELYDIMKASGGKIQITIALHDCDRRAEGVAFMRAFLKGVLTGFTAVQYEDTFRNSYNNIRGATWPDCNNSAEWYTLPEEIKQECIEVFDFEPVSFRQRAMTKLAEDFVAKKVNYVTFSDENNVTIHLTVDDQFWEAAVIPNYETKTFTLHDSDPELAHRPCKEFRFDVIHTSHGQLYKCSVTEMLPEFDKQFYIEMSDADRKMLHNVYPATLDMDDEELKHWFSLLDTPVPQCKFCTTNYTPKRIVGEVKKVVFLKKTKTD